jgi:hypothetical protein
MEVKFFRTAGYALFEHTRNEKMLKELKAEAVDEETKKDTNQTVYDM